MISTAVPTTRLTSTLQWAQTSASDLPAAGPPGRPDEGLGLVGFQPGKRTFYCYLGDKVAFHEEPDWK